MWSSTIPTACMNAYTIVGPTNLKPRERKSFESASPAADVAESYRRIENAYPGRFLLGIGVGHPEHTGDYKKPYDALVEYLDELDGATVPTSRRVLAAPPIGT